MVNTLPDLVDVFDTPAKWNRTHWHSLGRNHAEAALARALKDGTMGIELFPAYFRAILAGAEFENERHAGSMQGYYWMGYIKTLILFAKIASDKLAA